MKGEIRPDYIILCGDCFLLRPINNRLEQWNKRRGIIEDSSFIAHGRRGRVSIEERREQSAI